MRLLAGLALGAVLLAAASASPAATRQDCVEHWRNDEAPAFSPDGTELAFIRRHVFECPNAITDDQAVELIGADGSGERTLARGGYFLQLSWSHDGTRLAVEELTASGGVLHITRPDGTELVRAVVRLCCAGGPVWSPDDRHVAIGSLIVDATDGRVHGEVISTYGTATWSPDSTRIAYLGPIGLEVASAETGAHRWIAPGGSGNIARASWSPDGARIAYQMGNELRFVDPDGTNLVEFPDEGILLDWSPDSRAVLIYVPDDGRLVEIDRDDGAARRVGSSRLFPTSFSWTRQASAFADVDLCPRQGIFVQPVNDVAQRVSNDCVIRGTPGPDRLVGTALPDVLVGGAGSDTLDGQGGDDVLIGGRGNDHIVGGEGDDSAYGDAGNDTISAETVFGGSGRDVLTAGNDPRWQAKAVHARDHQRDVVRCPLGQWPGPTLAVDKIDQVSSRCYGT